SSLQRSDFSAARSAAGPRDDFVFVRPASARSRSGRRAAYAHIFRRPRQTHLPHRTNCRLKSSGRHPSSVDHRQPCTEVMTIGVEHRRDSEICERHFYLPSDAWLSQSRYGPPAIRGKTSPTSNGTPKTCRKSFRIRPGLTWFALTRRGWVAAATTTTLQTRRSAAVAPPAAATAWAVREAAVVETRAV